MSVYDIRGNEISSGGEGFNTDGYIMVTEPSWEQSKLINTDNTNYDIGSVQNATAALKASDYIPVMGHNSLLIPLPHVTTATPVWYGVCFYDKNKNALPNYTTTVYWGRGQDEAKVKTAEVFFPRKAKYFKTTYWSDTQMENNPDIPAFTYTFTPGIFEDDIAITEEVPANRGMMNAIRRVRQLTDIKWIPKVKIPRIDRLDGSDHFFLDWFMPDEEYMGIPYSGSGQTNSWQYGVINPNTDAGKWGRYQLYVGLVTDFETYMTAMRYPNSIFGERINQAEASTDSSIYGSVCTALLSYGLGLKMPIWPVNQFMSNENYGKNYFYELGKIGTDIPLENIKLCDVFHNSGHVALITDITRDTEGNITHVEVSEEAMTGNANNTINDGSSKFGGKARRRNFKVADFLASYWITDYKLYRYKNFTDIPYTPTPYVNTGREAFGSPIVDLPCIPYLGNKAKYRKDYIYNTKILIGATGFTNLVVTKDGNAFGTFPINNQTEISVGFGEKGNYEAHLTGSGGLKTTSCYWTVED